jgi:membrane protein DedA with SNARE-associated domain
MPSLTHLSPDSPASFLVALLVPLLDAIIPAFPSETAVIALGVASGPGLGAGAFILVVLAAAGAFLGDNLAYWIGRRWGVRVSHRILGREDSGRRQWAERTLERHGGLIIIVCRFIPGGRTAVTLTAGMIGFPRRRFVSATAAAAVLWATYAFSIGRIGGAFFEDNHWLALGLAFGIATAVAVLVEIGRRIRGRLVHTAAAPVGPTAQPQTH